jgi:hypothetical protein
VCPFCALVDRVAPASVLNERKKSVEHNGEVDLAILRAGNKCAMLVSLGYSAEIGPYELHNSAARFGSRESTPRICDEIVEGLRRADIDAHLQI